MDNVIQVGIQTTGAEQAQAAANTAAQGIHNIGTAAATTTSETSEFSASLTATNALLEKILIASNEAAVGITNLGAESVATGAKVESSMAASAAEIVKVAGAANVATAALSMMGSVLGVGAFVALFAGMEIGAAKAAVEIKHLSEVTGESAGWLAAFKADAREAGVETDGLEKWVTKFASAITAAQDPTSTQAEAFRQLGVNIHDSQGHVISLSSAYEQMAVHLKNSTQYTADEAAMRVVNGKSVVGLTAYLKNQGEEMKNVESRHKSLAQAMEDAAGRAEEITTKVGELQEQFEIFKLKMLPIIDIIKDVGSAFEFLANYVASEAAAVTFAYEEMLKSASDFLEETKTLFTKGYSAWEKMSKRHYKEEEDLAKAHMQAIANIWKGKEAPQKKAPPPPDKGGPDTSDTTDTKGDNKRAIREAELAGQEAHQKALLELQRNAIETAYKLKQIGWDQEAAALDKVEAAELAMTLSFINKKISIAEQDPDHPERVTELNAEKIAAKDAYNDKIQEIESKRLEAQKKYDDELQRLQDEIADSIRLDNEKKLADAQKAFDKLMAMMDEWHKKQIEAEDETQIKLNESKMRGSQSSEKKDLESFAGNPEAQAKIIANYRDQQIEIEKVITALKVKLALENGASAEDVSAIESEGAEKISEITDQANIKISHLKLTMKDLETTFESAFKKMGTAFNTAMAGWITGTESFRKAFSKGLSQIEGDLAQSLLRMGEQELKHLAMKLAANKTTNITKNTQDALGAARSDAIETESAMKSIFKAAKKAYAQVSANAGLNAIPVVGPAIAKAAGVAAFAGIMALAAFEQGGVVGNQEQMAVLHPREMVLPAPISEGVQKMVQNGGGNNTSGGDIHLHVHAVDASGVANFFHNNRDQIAKTMKRAQRDGHPAFA